MTRALTNTLLGLLAVAGLTVTLQQDLSSLSLSQGTARLQTGDLSGAEMAFNRAISLGSDAAPLAYNLGVSLYRKGDFVRAQQQFATALATAGPDLAAAIHYNRGNSRFRQGELLAANDPQAARSLLSEAMADYRQALAGDPEATDAAGNLAAARLRLAALGKAASPDGSSRPPASDEKRAGETAKDQGSKAESEPKKADSSSTPEATTADAAQAADGTDDSLGKGKPRRDLTQPEVERLLNEARGRERPAGVPHAGNPAGKLAQPDKDW
jgi:tetratricopeptide (TPR) repeat protein